MFEMVELINKFNKLLNLGVCAAVITQYNYCASTALR